MRNYLTTLPAAVALTGAFLWFSAAPAYADCLYIRVCLLGRCVSVLVCSI